MATLWIIGMMGSGKSTVGPLVAAKLGMPFADLDDDIERATGRSVEELFAGGVDGFRATESEALGRRAGADAVVACGGGVVLRAVNVRAMRAGGGVALLSASVETLTERVNGGEGRPLLTGGAPHDRLRAIALEREASYAAAADVVIDTNGRSPAEIAGEVAAWWLRSI